MCRTRDDGDRFTAQQALQNLTTPMPARIHHGNHLVIGYRRGATGRLPQPQSLR
jgi:hypothetical protein